MYNWEIFNGGIRKVVMDAVNEESCTYLNEEDILISDNDGYITFSYIEDDKWINDCTIKVLINGITTTKEELAILFPDAEKMF